MSLPMKELPTHAHLALIDLWQEYAHESIRAYAEDRPREGLVWHLAAEKLTAAIERASGRKCQALRNALASFVRLGVER